MAKLNLLILACAIVSVRAAATYNKSLDSDELQEDGFPYVLAIKNYIRDGQVAELFTEFALGHLPCKLKYCNISVIDILRTVNISTYPNHALIGGIERMKIIPEDAFNLIFVYNITSDKVERFFQEYGLSVSALYGSFRNMLNNPQEELPRVMQMFNVSMENFTNQFLFGNDSSAINVLAKGNYTLDNIQRALNYTNKTSYDILHLLPFNDIFHRLTNNNKDPKHFDDFLKNLGLTTVKIGHFYDHLNITDRHFYGSAYFVEQLNHFYFSLNPELLLATAVSEYELVTYNKAKIVEKYLHNKVELFHDYVKMVAEYVENPLISFEVQDMDVNHPQFKSQEVAVFSMGKQTKEYIRYEKNYTNMQLINCTYVSQITEGYVYHETVPRVNLWPNKLGFAILKSNVTIFGLGSPFVCNGTLYGLAVEERPKDIVFTTLFGGNVILPSPPKPPLIPPLVASKPSDASTLQSSFIFPLTMGLFLRLYHM